MRYGLIAVHGLSGAAFRTEVCETQPCSISNYVLATMDISQADIDKRLDPSGCGEAACNRVVPPVPLFAGPVSHSTCCIYRARQSIARALAQEDDDSIVVSCGSSSLGHVQQHRNVKGARKRKACHPQRSDDGCEDLRRRQPAVVSTDKEFSKMLGKSSKVASGNARKKGVGAARQKVGLSAHEAIAESQKRAKKRKHKHVNKGMRSVIVSGVVVPLTPVPPRAGDKHGSGTAVTQQVIDILGW